MHRCVPSLLLLPSTLSMAKPLLEMALALTAFVELQLGSGEVELGMEYSVEHSTAT